MQFYFNLWLFHGIAPSDGQSHEVVISIFEMPSDGTPPTPDPLTWDIEPEAISQSQISMESIQATDLNSPVEYYFNNEYSSGIGGSNSGWQGVTTYTDTGLAPNCEYGYRVKARDALGNETDYSTSSYIYTYANGPAAPIINNPTETSLDVDVQPNSNPSYTVYTIYNYTNGYYVSSSGGNNGEVPVWKTDSMWGSVTVNGLLQNQEYTFGVKAKNGNDIETGWVYNSGSTTSPTTETLQIVSPNGGEIWAEGSIQEVRWSYSGPVGNVNIEHSIDNGVTWIAVSNNELNDGSYMWTVPNTPAPLCFIRIEDVDNHPSDMSDQAFAIEFHMGITITYPNGGEVILQGDECFIEWSSAGPIGLVDVYATYNGGSTWEQIANDTPNDGECRWSNPAIVSAICLVRVEAVSGIPSDSSDAYFEIQEPGSISQYLFYVAPPPLGDNSNPGTYESPFATAQYALNSLPVGGGTVFLLPSVDPYQISTPIQMSAYDTLTGYTGIANDVIINGQDTTYLIQIDNLSNDVVISNMTLKNGLASGGNYNRGGAIWINGPSPKILNCIIQDSKANDLGGGIFCRGGSCSPLIKECLITGNHANTDGSAICSHSGSTPIVEDCTIAGNTGGGAVTYFEDNAPTMKRVIISGNEGLGFERAGSNPNPASLECVCISGNSGGDWDDSDISSMLGQDGNIDDNPQFCDASTDDYSLCESSPCAPDNHPSSPCTGLYIGALPTNPMCECLSGIVEPDLIPAEYILFDAFPNPFNPETCLSYYLPQQDHAYLRIYDLHGRLIIALARGEEQSAGHHTAIWTGVDEQGQLVAAGVYFYQLEVGSFRDTKRITLVK